LVLQHKNLTNEQSECIISFGSNKSSDFGVSVQTINEALRALSRKGLFKVEISRFYRTPAFPAGSGPDFVNGVVHAETKMNAEELLAVLHDVEAEFGRTRDKRWEARVLDLDLIDFDGQIAPSAEAHEEWRNMPLDQQIDRTPDQMILPHPRVQNRAFVLVPMRDVAPNWVHPVTKVTLDQMLTQFSAAELAEIQPLNSTD
jgi:2-amino-4-hydroxy-6-hydroxymethyldihydropteridine diphosphokinase